MKEYSSIRSTAGFTLVELIIAMLLTGIISIGIFSAYKAQQDSFIVQDQVTEIQQNVRAGVATMIRELRMAGYDPSHTATCAGISSVANSRLQIQMDLNGDGDCGDINEIITYGLTAGDDVDGDGIADGGVAADEWTVISDIDQTTGGGSIQPIADNVSAIEFYYTLDDGTQTTSPADLTAIRTVQITILARANKPDRDFTNTMTYNTPSGTVWDPTPNDNYRRRLLISTVQFRNLGLKLI